MEETFKISFIIPTYNLPTKMLQECVRSILSLPLEEKEREIIIVDDGSKENPFPQLEADKDRLMYIRQTNQGVSEARNTGLRIATGQYIQFVDGDDYLISQPYQQCIRLIKEEQADIVIFDMTSQKECVTGTVFTKPEDGASFMRHHNIAGAVWGYIFKKKLLADLHFTKGINYGEDEEFTPQLLLRAESVIKTNAKAYFYRQHDCSATHLTDRKTIEKRLNDNMQVIERLNYLANTGTESDRKALKRRVAQLTMDYIYNVIILTRDFNLLEKSIEQLYQKGLFPLPDRHYTRKYDWFRRISKSKAGRRLLYTLLPMMK